jgi:hypothetical protein
MRARGIPVLDDDVACKQHYGRARPAARLSNDTHIFHLLRLERDRPLRRNWPDRRRTWETRATAWTGHSWYKQAQDRVAWADRATDFVLTLRQSSCQHDCQMRALCFGLAFTVATTFAPPKSSSGYRIRTHTCRWPSLTSHLAEVLLTIANIRTGERKKLMSACVLHWARRRSPQKGV